MRIIVSIALSVLVLSGQFAKFQVTSSTVSGSAIQETDLSYLGAYLAPYTTDGSEERFGTGFALRYETTDVTNQVHFVSGAFAPGDCNSVPIDGALFEWRDATPTSGAPDPLDPANYSTATLVKTWGDIYGGKRQSIINGSTVCMNSSELGGWGFYVDSSNWNRIFWNYGNIYSGEATNECNSWYIGYSDLVYSSGASTSHGPWTMTGQGWKSGMTGFIGIPHTFANSYLGGKYIGVGLGGYKSLVSSCDASMGVSVTAINDPGAATEKTDLANTSLVGYWPYADGPGAGKGRETREGTLLTPIDGWPANKLGWTDYISGGAWLTTQDGLRSGPCFVETHAQGLTSYTNATIWSEYYQNWIACYSADDLQAVAQGSNIRYVIEPTNRWQILFPGTDYTSSLYNPVTTSITGITSVNGESVATVHWPGHGFTPVGSNTCGGIDFAATIGVTGADQNEYNGIWGICDVIDDNYFKYTNNSSAPIFDGVTATGTLLYHHVNLTPDSILGASYDSTTHKFYVLTAPTKGATGLQTRLYVQVYQIN